MIELNYNGNTIKIHNDDASYAYSALKSKPQLVLKFSLSEYIDFPVGTYCDFQGVRYVLKYADNLKKNGERDIEYTMTMGTDVDDLADYKMRNSVDGRLKFSMCATPKEFIEEIVAELNSKGTGSTWSVGECIESTEKTVEFNHTYIYDALASIAEKFDTEWEIVDHAISLRKVEYFKGSPLELSYGKGCGFIPSVGRTIASDSRPIKRLYVQGGSDNIDKSKYGSSELHLPKSQSYTYKGHTYTSDKDGSYIERSDKTVQATKEDSLDCSEIYPSRVGTVTSVETVNKDKNFYDIIDNTIPDKLNFNDCIIEGETPTIIFQSGMLAGDGKEFEFKYTHTVTKDGKTTAERRFEIVPQEIDGVVMPNETFKPKEGDKYAVFGIMLPDAYICDNDTKTGASWDMMKEAAQYLFEHEEQKYSFTGTLQGLWTKKRWTSIGGRFKVGSYIRFKDKQFMSDGVDLRITGIKQYVNSPYSPTIEISNQTAATGISTDLQKIDGTQVTIDDTKRDIVSYTKRRFRDAKETAEMLQNALLHFTDAINPITIVTMQLLVGDESLQFDYIASTSQPENVVACNFKWNEKEKTISCDKTAIIHYTVGINDLSSSHTSNERKKWNVMGLASGALNDASKKYYIYIKCPYSSFDSNNVSTETAEFVLSETAKSMDDTDNSCYYFLAGILNSEYDGTRSFVAMNGFTEITPGQILADRLISKSGTSYFDMLNNAMRLGDRLKFNVNGDGELLLNGTLVQSQSGDTAPLGCYRGVWNSTYVYYKGDEVTYTVNGNTSTYRYINDTPSKGILPLNTTYWTVVAKGAQGIQGISPNTAFKSTAFIRQNSTPSTPTGGRYSSPVPETTGWSDGIPSGEAILWASTRIFSSDGKSPQEDAWSTPKQMTDTADFDVEFSSETSPSAPSGHPNSTSGWSNTASESTIWMATSVKQNGVWSAWTVSKIKGEKGNDGKSINIKGTLSSTSSLPTKPSDESDCYIISGHLYVWDGDSWEDAGKFQGDAGKSAYLHIKYADSLTTGDWSSNNGETPSKYIGIYSDNDPEDKLTWSLYTWTKWQGDDGFGYEYIYKRTTDATAPSTPTLSSNADDFVPTGWTDDPTGVSKDYPYEWVCYRKKTEGTWGAFIGSSSDNTVAALWAKFGDDGDYYEYRYAKNGSTTKAPTLDTAVAEPSGWSVTQPSISKGEYLWMTVAKKNSDGTLDGTWSTPVRITPYDGVDGDSPALVFRGNYDSSKTYYGNKYRVDAVKYNSVYYVARIDAGEFKGVVPTNTSKWNGFGAQFESIATNLLLAEGASIGDWWISNGKIVSTLGDGTKIELDAKTPIIKVTSTQTAAGTGDYSNNMNTSEKSVISLNAQTGEIETRNDDGVSYMSANGVFSNHAMTNALPSSTGFTHYGAIVGLGFGNVSKDTWAINKDQTIIAGVYGRASNSNSNPCPSYGGYFNNLKAAGFILNTKYVDDDASYSERQIGASVSQVIGLVDSGDTLIYLPTDAIEGKVIKVHQMGKGNLRIYPAGNQKMYDDTSVNSYYDCGCGYTVECIFGKWNIGSTTTEVWIIRRYHF